MPVNQGPVILQDYNGNQVATQDGVAIPTNTPRLLAAGSDGTNTRTLKTSADGTVAVSQAVPILNATPTTGSISALNGTVSVAVQGYNSCSVTFSGTWVGVVVLETSTDGGTTWLGGAFIGAPPIAAPIPAIYSFLTANGIYQVVGIGATTNVRIRAASYTSGPINVLLTFGTNLPSVLSCMSSIQQTVAASLYNSSTTNLAAGASFTGSAEVTLGVAAVQILVFSDQPIQIQIQQSTDGTNWDVTDTQVFLANTGDGRDCKTISSYFRIIATNVGYTTTTTLRIKTILCPISEPLPRALTNNGKLKLTDQTTNWAPSPTNHVDGTLSPALLVDTDNNLNTRSRCLTDESSFRDDFTTGDIYTDLTGTVYFTNGSTIVTGNGTAFLSELNIQRLLKLSTHADSVYASVATVLADDYLELAEPYTGATDNGTGRASYWLYNVEAGGAITQTGSEILLASGTTSGTNVQAIRSGDYLPYVIGFKARVTQRIANQEAHIGLADGNIGTVENQALVVFDGTTNTTVKLRTSSSSADVETTTVTLPDGLVTSTAAYYQIEVMPSRVILFVNSVKLAEHQLHIPGPYDPMDCHCCIKNTGVAASSTTLALDTYFLTNYDMVEVSTSARGGQLTVKEMRASSQSCTNVAATVADTSLLVPNQLRLGCSIYNDSVANLYLKLGSGASTTSFTIMLGRYDYYEAPANYVGRINGYWSAATGSARITELT